MCAWSGLQSLPPGLTSPHVLSAVEISRGRRVCLDRETVSANAYFVRDTDIGHFYAIRQSDGQTEDDHARATASKQRGSSSSSVRSIAEVCLVCSLVYDLTCKGDGNKVNIEGVSRALYERRDCAVNICALFSALL